MKFMLEKIIRKIVGIPYNGNIISFFAGILCALSFAPFYLFFAAIISISIFYFLLNANNLTAKESAKIGFFYGFGYFLAGNYWIAISLLVDSAQFAWLIPFCLTLIPSALAIYFLIFAASYRYLCQKLSISENYQKALIFALLWVFLEILRSILFSGFPWNLIGYSLMFSDYTSQFAAIFGIYGLSFIAILFCLSLALLFRSARSDKIFIAFLVLAFLGNFAFGYYRIKFTEIKTDNQLKFRLVQGNIKQDLKWDPVQKYQNFSKHINITNQEDKAKIALVIWSETAVPYMVDNNPELLQELKKAIPDEGSLLFGGIRSDLNENGDINNVWNSLFVFNKDGEVSHYNKHHLVPFGEYIPFANFLPFVKKITNGSVGFSKGDGPRTLMINNIGVSPLICYEAIFSNNIVNKDNYPDLLVNITNDAWFGNSSGPYQHFDMTRMRAIEYGLPLARVANTGITAFIDPLGRVIDKIDLNNDGFIDVNAVLALKPTIYARLTYLPLSAMFLLVLLFLILTNHTTKNARSKKVRSS